MSNAISSKGVSLASIFDPYQAGTTKARASGIDDAGTDTSNLYASISYGSAAAATGISSEGADLNTLYAAKGTASYALSCDGTEYFSQGLTSASLNFTFSSASAWAIGGHITSSSPASGPVAGSLPSSATKYRLTVSESGTTSAITTAPTGVWAPITSELTLVAINLSSSTSAYATADMTLELQNASGDTISTTGLSFNCHTIGSA